jgi:hypothetical protein
VRDDLKPHSFQHPVSNILNLKFGKPQEWLHFWKNQFANATESNGQDVGFGFRWVVGGQHERRLTFVLLIAELYRHGSCPLYPVKVKSGLHLENLLASLDF